MREIEYLPLHADGFRDIVEKDLHKVFVAPFAEGVEHRTDLLLNFVQFFKQFKRLGISAEIWIDGSFATYAPDPNDIDIVFFMNQASITDLCDSKQKLYDKLFLNRKFIKTLYKLEVFYARQNNDNDIARWHDLFGHYYDGITPKGIFRLNYKQ